MAAMAHVLPPSFSVPTLELIGPNGEMELTYDASDPQTLPMLRAYQSKVRETTPDWTTQFVFNAADNKYRLFVFPISSAPWFLLTHRHGY